MAGKWHLGFVPGTTPKDRGFNHAFAFMGGGTSHFNDAIPRGPLKPSTPTTPATASASPYRMILLQRSLRPADEQLD